jgi:hypothetical protein
VFELRIVLTAELSFRGMWFFLTIVQTQNIGAGCHGNRHLLQIFCNIFHHFLWHFKKIDNISWILRLCISCQFKSLQRMGINIWYRIFSSCELSVVVVRRKLFQRSSPLKLLDQLESNLVWIITRVSSFKIVSCDAVHQSTWPLLLKIEHMVKLWVFG